MSADNGIYILKTKDQYRIIHAQAIENVYWEHDNHYAYYSNCRTNMLVPSRVVEFWGSSKYTKDEAIALKVANAMLKNIERNCGICEYGIRTFTYNKTWKHILEDAKEKAKIELDYLKNNGGRDYSIQKLENILKL